MKNTKSSIFYSAITSLFVCTLFLGFNYLEAQWSGAPSTPPNGNIDAPIHTGGGEQMKSGAAVPVAGDRITTGQFLASDMMRSDRYCDASGNNCFGPGDVGGPVTNNSIDGLAVCLPVNSDLTTVEAGEWWYLKVYGTEDTASENSCGIEGYYRAQQNWTGGLGYGGQSGSAIESAFGVSLGTRCQIGGSPTQYYEMCSGSTADSGQSCEAQTWGNAPLTRLPAAVHGQVEMGGSDSSYPAPGMYQCLNGTWTEISAPVQDRNR